MAKQDKHSAERERAQEPERQQDKIEDLEVEEKTAENVRGGALTRRGALGITTDVPDSGHKDHIEIE